MKTVKDIQEEIIASMVLEDIEQSVRVLNEVYGMRVTLVDDQVHFLEEDITYGVQSYSKFMEYVVRQADRQELLENYELLSGQQWEWSWCQEETDCQPEWMLRNKS